jgi:hypothetical protein
MLNSRLYLIGLLLIFLCTAGFSGLHGSISTLGDDEPSKQTVSYVALLFDREASIVSVKMQTPVCVLPGNANEAKRRKYEACIAEAECEEWKKYQDDENGNIAMVCLDEGEQARACILGENASGAKQIEFADCLRKLKCENLRRHKDSANGNTTMMCEDE